MEVKGIGKVALTVLVSVTWMMVSTVLILLNKFIMVDLGFPYPMLVAAMGMATTGLLSYVCCRVLEIVECKADMDYSFWLTRIVPVGLFMGASLATGNMVYMHLTVSLIQMLKATTPIITMLCLFIARLEDPVRNIILSVVITAGGTALAAYGEVNLNVIGICLMFTSEFAEAIRLVMTQQLLVGLNFHPIEGLMYLTPVCAGWLFLGSTFHELPSLLSTGRLNLILTHPICFSAACVLGFAVNGLSYFTIKLASSLTLKVLGTVKNTLLVVFSVIFLGELVTKIQALGYVISLIGFSWYQKIKMTQIAASPKSAGCQPVVTVIAKSDGQQHP